MFYGAEGIRKSWQLLDIPSGLLNRQLVFPGVDISKQGDNGEQAQQGGSNAQDGQICPLSLGLHAEVGSCFVESHFDLPTSRKPLDDLFGGDGEIGAQHGLRLEPVLRIADNDPADRHHGLAAVAPDGGAGGDFDFPFLLAIPFFHGQSLPASMLVIGDLLQGRQASALFRGRPICPGFFLAGS